MGGATVSAQFIKINGKRLYLNVNPTSGLGDNGDYAIWYQ